MAAEFGRIDFMFIGPPSPSPHPAAGTATAPIYLALPDHVKYNHGQWFRFRAFRSSTGNPSKVIMQGLFVLFACVGSGDPVRVLCLFHNKYTGYN